MKKLFTILLLVLVVSLVLVGCIDTNKTETAITVSVLTNEAITLDSDDVATYDFTKHFMIFEGVNKVEVLDSYIDTSKLPLDGGNGKVILTYKGKSESLNVVIVKKEVVVSKTQDEITLDTKQIKTFDFTTLFTITINGEPVEVLESYLNKQSLPILPGKGNITLNYNNQSATIEVNLVEAEKEVVVSCVKESLELSDEEYESYKYTDLFSITVEGSYTTVMKAYITLSEVVDGKATVTCTYMEKSAVLPVTVKPTVYEITLSQEEIDINQNIALDYDYLSLFTATRNGEPYELDHSMATNNVTSELGTYTYTVTIGKAEKVTKTLTVNVVFSHTILVVNCYNDVKIALNELSSYDFTCLFALYVDGVATQVTADMVDVSWIETAEANNEYAVLLSYSIDNDTVTKEAVVKVTEPQAVVIKGKNIAIYPSSSEINFTDLFEITKGGVEVKVTSDMVSGSIDYTTEGDYIITCTYLGETQTATVTVRNGVVIGYKNGNEINVMQGTDQSTYNFANDFVVTINGLRFTNIENCIDTSNVDFSTEGEYTATILIQYNTEKPQGLSGKVTFIDYTAEITYIVVGRSFRITKPTETVVLEKGTTSYNVLSPVSVVINNMNQKLVTNPEWVSPIACYVEILSQDIDFNSVALQEVKLAIYVYSLDSEPETITYYVRLQSEIVLTANDCIVFVGETFYTENLFTVTADGENVSVDYSMINGKVDTFRSGVYNVTINYQGYEATSKVIVYPNELKGTYVTSMKSLEVEEDFDEDGYLITEGKPSSDIGDLVIFDEKTITLRGVNATSVQGIDENTLRILVGTNYYTLHYSNGIVVADAENPFKLQFSESRRPLVYYTSSIYECSNNYIINSSSTHILNTTFTGYTLEVFEFLNTLTNESLTFAIKIALETKTAADTIYAVTWGEASFDDGLVVAVGEIGTLNFDGNKYEFTFETAKRGKINKKDPDDKLLANTSFSGIYNGQEATLSVNQNGAYTLTVNGETYFNIGYYEILNEVKYGGYDKETDIVTLFSYLKIDSNKPYFSDRFQLNMQNKTFEVLPKTTISGKFSFEKSYIFLDGYGKGLVNFDTTSYYVVKFNYEVNGNELIIRFYDTQTTFAYGKYATFTVGSFDNLLTVREITGISLEGKSFENEFITNGAIVKFNKTAVGLGQTNAVKAEIENSITIITKDGELTGADKSACIDYTAVKFNGAGFYRLGVKVEVNGEIETLYYAIQVLPNLYANHEILDRYDLSLINKDYHLQLDAYGRATLTIGAKEYNGTFKLEENTFVARFYSGANTAVLTGKLEAKGLLSVRCTGFVSFIDYLVSGTSFVAGTEGFILRRVQTMDADHFILCQTANYTGTFVKVDLIEGSLNLNNCILKVWKTEEEYVLVRINSWSDIEKGLTKCDEYYGTYTNGENTLKIDGFGGATLNDEKATYQINANKTLTVETASGVYFLTINKVEGTYQDSDIDIDNLLVGKTFTASYYFTCYSDNYIANTTISFHENGIVVIKSTSEDHDDIYGCYADEYKPIFASETGYSGTFTVAGNTVTITVKATTFTFKISDVTKLNEIVCLTTTLTSDDQGYFNVGTKFNG